MDKVVGCCSLGNGWPLVFFAFKSSLVPWQRGFVCACAYQCVAPGWNYDSELMRWTEMSHRWLLGMLGGNNGANTSYWKSTKFISMSRYQMAEKSARLQLCLCYPCGQYLLACYSVHLMKHTSDFVPRLQSQSEVLTRTLFTSAWWQPHLPLCLSLLWQGWGITHHLSAIC